MKFYEHSCNKSRLGAADSKGCSQIWSSYNLTALDKNDLKCKFSLEKKLVSHFQIASRCLIFTLLSSRYDNPLRFICVISPSELGRPLPIGILQSHLFLQFFRLYYLFYWQWFWIDEFLFVTSNNWLFPRFFWTPPILSQQ